MTIDGAPVSAARRARSAGPAAAAPTAHPPHAAAAQAPTATPTPPHVPPHVAAPPHVPAPPGPPPPVSPAAEPATERHPARRYPWQDDPHYDPAAHRRPPASNWTPPAARPPTAPAAPGYPPAAHPPTPHPPAAPAPAAHASAAHASPAHPGHAASPAGGAPPGPSPTMPATAPQPGPPTGPATDAAAAGSRTAGIRMPRKLTVTRVAALRGRQLTENSIRAFHRAASADGADRSGLTALTYATMMTYAVDAAVAVALANTLFFAAATAESKTNVALYLAITVAPFAVVAPVIGPLLDRLQRGRRAALAVSFGGRAVLAVVMALHYDSWLLYPAALGMLVLSKSFVVLKAAVTPRVLPPTITLVTTNARLTTFGLVAGGVFGAGAAGVSALWGSAGALFYTAALAAGGTALCLRIPRWVESTAGEVPAALRSTYRGRAARGRRRPISRGVLLQLWGNGSIRVLTGFLTLFVAFVVKAHTETDPRRQLLLLGVVGAAAGAGSFVGNAIGARRRFGHPVTVLLSCIGAAVGVSVLAALLPGIGTAALVGLVAASASALAKVCLDAVIQRDLPDESRASAFGRSETVLQLSWVFGGALGVLLPHENYWLGFSVVAAVVAVGGVQTGLLARGRSLLPFLHPRRPEPVQARP